MIRAADTRVARLEKNAGIGRHFDIDAIASALSDDELDYAIERLKGVGPDAASEERFVRLLEKYSLLMRAQ